MLLPARVIRLRTAPRIRPSKSVPPSLGRPDLG
ncbi:MAG: hypothetical protein KatS3mg008_2193 [Acidimicrobiales bacterium]|nr:MAG: hypothetical protein KatS3mg008_2193 [Acidimicrobiales bacterium]